MESGWGFSRVRYPYIADCVVLFCFAFSVSSLRCRFFPVNLGVHVRGAGLECDWGWLMGAFEDLGGGTIDAE